MQRYEMISVTRCGEAWQELQKEEYGDWVRYEDVEAELATLRTENERLKVRAEVAERALENACNELSAWSTETISAIYEKHIADAERELRTQATQKG